MNRTLRRSRIVLLGASGRLGAALSSELSAARHDVLALDREELDIRDPRQIRDTLSRLQPEVILNCTAYNAVDAAERDAPAAFAVNAVGPSFLAAAARFLDAVLVHYSTDFVFDGCAVRPYSEDDQTNPLSVYGASKLAGEHEARTAPRHYVLRLESLFGGVGFQGHRATIDLMVDGLLAGQPVRAMVDRTVSPSYVPDVVRATRLLVEGSAPYGVYHCVNTGCCTWWELASFAARALGVSSSLVPATSGAATTGAKRPRFCALSNDKLRRVGVVMPAWESAVSRHLAARLTQPDVASTLLIPRDTSR